MTDPQTPTDDQLRNYLLGNLTVDELSAVESRIEEDPECANRMATTAKNLDDTLLTALRKRPPLKTELDEESGYLRGLDLVREIGRDKSVTPAAQTPAELQTAILSAADDTANPELQWQKPVSTDEQALGTLRDYRLLKKLGEGGMGTVYKALQMRLEKVVALKVLPQDRLRDADAVARFEREMKAVGRLDHPNIVRATDAGEYEGQHFLVMEYIDGVDLMQHVQQHGPMSVPQAVDVIRQAAIGLQYAHEQGLVHRDIKPSNLMVQRHQTNVKILDLGLARLESEPSIDADTQAELTTAGSVMGTVDYMSPEQALDTHTADAKSDIYSLGCTLYFLLTGKPPYHGKTVMERLIAHREQPIPSLKNIPASGKPQQSGTSADPDAIETARFAGAEHSPGLSQLDAVFRRMVAKNPVDRYPSMGAVLAELDVLNPTGGGNVTHLVTTVPTILLPGLGFSPPTPDSVPKPQSLPVPPPMSRRTKLAVWGTSAAFMLAGVIWIATNKERWKIETSGDGVEVSTNDGDVTARDTQTGTTVKISPGGTNVAVKDDRNKVKVTDDGFEITRDGKVIAKGKKIVMRSGPFSSPGSRTNSDNFALQYNGKDSYVALPSIQDGAKSPITLEAWVTLDPKAPRLATVIEAAGFKLRNFMVGPQWMVIAYGTGDKTELLGDPERSTVGRPVHLACVYDQKMLRLYVDGSLRSRGPLPNGFTLNQIKLNKFATIGNSISLAEVGAFRGIIDEVRISTVARYTLDFTPEQRFTPDQTTFALYHCDDAKGNKLLDSSGNDRHGLIRGATWVKDLGDGKFTPYDANPKEAPVKAVKPKRHQ